MEGPETRNGLYRTAKSDLHTISKELKEIQEYLMGESNGVSSSVSEKVNPSDVSLKKKILNSISDSSASIWESIQLLVSESLRISSLPLINITSLDASVYFISYNSMNGILESLKQSTSSLVDYIKDFIKDAEFLSMLLFIAISSAILASTFSIIPVLNRANGNKQRVLVLFLYLPQKIIDQEIDSCRKFMDAIPIVLYYYIYYII